VLNYRSYPKNKTGYPFFGTPCRFRVSGSSFYTRIFLFWPCTIFTGITHVWQTRRGG